MAVGTADIYGALITWLADPIRVGGDWWLNREPEQITAASHALPYNTLSGDFTTDWKMENAWSDEGEVVIKCYALTDDAARTTGEAVKAAFGESQLWQTIPATGFGFSEVSRKGWGLYTEEEPDKDGNIIYRFEVRFHVEAYGHY